MVSKKFTLVCVHNSLIFRTPAEAQRDARAQCGRVAEWLHGFENLGVASDFICTLRQAPHRNRSVMAEHIDDLASVFRSNGPSGVKSGLRGTLRSEQIDQNMV